MISNFDVVVVGNHLMALLTAARLVLEGNLSVAIVKRQSVYALPQTLWGSPWDAASRLRNAHGENTTHSYQNAVRTSLASEMASLCVIRKPCMGPALGVQVRTRVAAPG